MGMLIRRHRDRHTTEATEVATVTSEGGPTRKDLQAQAKALGLSTQGNKAELTERITAHEAELGKAHDAEVDKESDTEPDPGAGGDNPDAPAPEDGAGTEDNDPEETPEGE